MDPNLKCCVLGCHTRPNQGLRFYRIPWYNPQISSVWKQRISQSANIDFDILNDNVCELHFDFRCKTGNECALEEGSLPSLNLPSFGTIFSKGNAHFEMSTNSIEEPSFKISVDALSYHCRFCLRSGLLYEVEASTYRSKSFLSLIDLPPNVLPDNKQTNACLSCLKSILIVHQLSVAVEHSNTIVQLLLQNPKQCKVVSKSSFFDMKSELTYCNLILANSFSIKLEIEDNMVWANEDYEQKLVAPGESTSQVAYVNTENIDEKSKCFAENQVNVSKVPITSDKQYQKEFHKSLAIKGEYGDLCAKGIPDASQNSDSCVLMENNDDNAEIMISNYSDDSYAENRQFDSDQAPEYLNAVNNPTCRKPTFTTIDKNTHWNEIDDVYVCPICDWRNPSFHTFNVHMDKHKVYIGKNSTIGSQELETLETDPVRNADGRYQYSECPKAVVKKKNFSQHKKMHRNGRPYKCIECSKTFSRKSNFSAHRRTHTNEKPYKCFECLKTFSQKGTLDIHRRIHTNERPYKCTECQKAFSQKCTLDTHKTIHTNERPFKCTECPKTFKGKSDLRRHKRIHTNDRSYNCTECPKFFSRKSSLDRHKRIHNNERPYKCTECPKAFRQSINLIIHQRIHTNERPYKCIECPKAFSDKSVLSRHTRIHTNERPYKCTECPKTFSQRSNLILHQRIHTNKRPYKCSECAKTFIRKSDLEIHKRIHTNERPYKCTECPKTFCANSNLYAHKKIHTNEGGYKCKFCPLAFNASLTLKRHVLSRHSDRKT